ncbi:MAG: DUF3151 family protein [Candidatus Tectomicrobia bacterium]|uniref:DUF3151 family protein n=1 Tax=Tectimicrobiota bacterium TaxID=2528274 RepID=A0A937VYE3_UNCTE|nr:DUF3151 family protein [Candidatus Tectomicrobia bacterium]
MAINIPLEPPVILPPDPGDSAQRVAAAHAAFQATQLTETAYREQLNAVAAQYPTCLTAWAALGELALPHDAIAAYAFFRVGYHRGLDRARGSGWRGVQPLPWTYDTNRGFLRCLYGLMCAATTIGEEAEMTRIHQFLLDMEPSNHFGLAPL